MTDTTKWILGGVGVVFALGIVYMIAQPAPAPVDPGLTFQPAANTGPTGDTAAIAGAVATGVSGITQSIFGFISHREDNALRREELADARADRTAALKENDHSRRPDGTIP